MQTLFIGFAQDAVIPQLKSIGIRIGYMLSTKFRLGGDITSFFGMEKSLRSMSFEQKLKFLDEREKDLPGPPQYYQDYKNNLKACKKATSREKGFIVIHKKLEIAATTLFNSYIDEMMNQAQASGLPTLKGLEESPSFGDYPILYNDTENGKDGLSKLSDILQSDLDEDDNNSPTIFILNYPFFLTAFNLSDSLMPRLNKFSKRGFLQELFKFSNYNDFSITDLNIIRFQVNKNLEDFQQAVNTFTALISDPAEAFKYLHKKVAPAAKILIENINKTEIVANYSKFVTHGATVGIVYLGLVPRQVVFKYFEFIKASKEATIAILNELDDKERNQLVPVLIITTYGARAKGKTRRAKEEPMPLKKSLSID